MVGATQPEDGMISGPTSLAQTHLCQPHTGHATVIGNLLEIPNATIMHGARPSFARKSL